MLKKTIIAELQIEAISDKTTLTIAAIDENTDKDKKKKSKDPSDDKKKFTK
jgi:hypothetical protein